MIAQTLEAQHSAGLAFFAVAGNATQPAWARRAEAMEGFAQLWRVHGAILVRVVLPALAPPSGASAAWDELRGLQEDVVRMAEDLARLARENGDGGGWIGGFDALKARFQRQCEREGAEVLPALRDGLPPHRLAALTREAAALV